MPHPKRGATRRGPWPSALAENFYERADFSSDAPQLWIYSDAWSYAPGDAARLHVSTNLPRYDIEIWRDGADAERVWRRENLPGVAHPAPEDCSARGCGWPVAAEARIPSDWRSGGYVVRAFGRDAQGAVVEAHHVFALRAPASAAGDLLLVAATGTWLAYNDWGGSNHYEGVTGPGRDQFSPRLSIHRPFSRGFVRLPPGAPRALLQTRSEMGAAVRYPHMEWAYANGYSKKYASAGWASYDRLFMRWAERAGYGVDLCAQHDLHLRPEILDAYGVVVFVGHDEYWSKEMRDAVDAFVARGGRVARFAANLAWQTRLEDGGAAQVCYKYRARAEDPLHQDPATRTLSTTAWEAREIGRPGAETFGVNALRGVYAGWGAAAPRHAGGFTVFRPDHWAFAGSDLHYGDVLSPASRIFGYEVDGLEYGFRDGLPFALGTDGAPDGVEILAMGVATLAEEDHHGDAPLFIAEDDLVFAAEAIDGAATPETLARRRYGSGMIVSFRRGRGAVFTAATCDWVVGLEAGDPYVERITRNVLDRVLAEAGES